MFGGIMNDRKLKIRFDWFFKSRPGHVCSQSTDKLLESREEIMSYEGECIIDWFVKIIDEK